MATQSERIEAAEKAREQFVLDKIKAVGSYYPLTWERAIYSALDRLMDKGAIRFDNEKGSYVLPPA